MKWILIGIAVVVGIAVLFYLGGLAYYSLVVNDRVTKELTDHPNGERANIVIVDDAPRWPTDTDELPAGRQSGFCGS